MAGFKSRHFLFFCYPRFVAIKESVYLYCYGQHLIHTLHHGGGEEASRSFETEGIVTVVMRQGDSRNALVLNQVYKIVRRTYGSDW